MWVNYTKENGCNSFSELKISDIIQSLNDLCPTKLILNDVVLYDDSIGEEDIGLEDAINQRLWNVDKYIITSLKIEIVGGHHAEINMCGEYYPDYAFREECDDSEECDEIVEMTLEEVCKELGKEIKIIK